MTRFHPTLTWLALLVASVVPGSATAGNDLRNICRPCDDADQCGDEADSCMIYRDDAGHVLRTACGINCGSDEDCGGLQCRTAPDSQLNQCYDNLNLCAHFPIFDCNTRGNCDPGEDCVNGHCQPPIFGLGHECESDDQCESGLCLYTLAGMVCTQDCDWLRPTTSCPAGFFCTERDHCGEGICAPGEPGAAIAGERCAGDTDCENAFCSFIESRGEAICTNPCDPVEPACPANTHCERRDVGCGSCVPDCVDRSDCPSGQGCVNGHCQDLLADGTYCSLSEQCLSGICQGGRCQSSGVGDASPDSGLPPGSTFTTDCTCTASGKRPVRFPLPLLLVLLPALGLFRRSSA